MADIDEELVERALGSRAVDDVAALRELERELERQGYVEHHGANVELTPRALRRMGAVALRRVFADIATRRSGSHDTRDAGPAGDLTGSTREWRFGDEQPLDVSATVRNAVLRSARDGEPLRLAPDDLTVSETERRGSAAVALLVDMSFSMHLRGTWGEAKTTALALHALITTKYPQDHIEIIGFSDYAHVMTPASMVAHEWERIQGTNLQHGLMLARRHLSRFPTSEPVASATPSSSGRPRRKPSPPPSPKSSAAPGWASGSTSSCSTTTLRWSSSCPRSDGATAAGSWCPSQAGSASTSSPTIYVPGMGAAEPAHLVRRR
jgi:uncharacterized protein with von Willebrand factor type A (vWA) domain